MILKDRFLTQLTPDTCWKLQRQEFGPNQSIKKLLQLAQMVYYGKKYTKENRKIKEPTKDKKGFPGGSEVKASACNVGDLGSIPGLGRSPGEGNGNPLQYSHLENPMDRGAWWATVHGVANSQTERLHSLTHSQKTEAPRWLLDLLWNSLREKMPRGTKVKRDELVITVERRGISSRIALRHLSHPQLHVWCAKDHTGEETGLRGVGPRGWTQENLDWRCLGFPTQALILITPEEPRVLITVGNNQPIFLWTLGQLSLCSLVRFPPDPPP